MPDPALTALRDDVVSKLDGLPGLYSKGMFGGYGFWADEKLFFGIADDGRVFFRTDESNRPAYDEREMSGFQYSVDEPPSDTYREVPSDVLADPAELLSWAEEAVEAARRAKATKRRR